MFDIVEFITRIFKKESAEPSRMKARERLKLVLVSDRANISPHLMESLREELIEVISRYMTIDTTSMEMGLERKNGSMALAANIPILDVKRNKKVARVQKSHAPIPGMIVEERPPVAPIVEPAPACAVAEVSPPPPPPEEVVKDAESEAASGLKKGKKYNKRFQARAQGRSLRKRAYA
jgi:cell division topological specificity factor